MIIVQGVFTIDEGEREQYLAQTLDMQRISRSEPGCIEYVFAADPLDLGRVVLSERWESRADLDAHIKAQTERRAAEPEGVTPPIVPTQRMIHFFEAEEFELG